MIIYCIYKQLYRVYKTRLCNVYIRDVQIYKSVVLKSSDIRYSKWGMNDIMLQLPPRRFTNYSIQFTLFDSMRPRRGRVPHHHLLVIDVGSHRDPLICVYPAILYAVLMPEASYVCSCGVRIIVDDPAGVVFLTTIYWL